MIKKRMCKAELEHYIDKPVEKYTEEELEKVKNDYIQADWEDLTWFSIIDENHKKLENKLKEMFTPEEKEILYKKRLDFNRNNGFENIRKTISGSL